jgi:CRISPR type III-A-associated RAMP protein Csm5
MANIKLTTLTPLHIGSGRIFRQNIDCLDFSQEKAWGIIDEHKILRIIGSENIDKWISKIENEQSIIDLIQSRKKDLKAADISLRVLKKGNNSNHPPITQELREQLHTHNHIPLLPGSSIKGGMRTAVFKKRLLADIFSGTLQISRNRDTNRKGEFVDKEIGKAILGKTPNDDPFRFIRISDFHFKLTEAWIAGSFNYNRWEDKRLKQWIELIPDKSVSYGTLDVGGTRYGLLRDGKYQSEGFRKIQEIISHEALFKTINAFSKEMIAAEIKWAESKNNLDSSTIEEYLSTLQEISKEMASLSSSRSCILRIGYGIGAKYMTGDWQSTGMEPELAEEWKRNQKNVRWRFAFRFYSIGYTRGL